MLKKMLFLVYSLCSISYSHAQDSLAVKNYIKNLQEKCLDRHLFKNSPKLINDTSMFYTFAIKIDVKKINEKRTLVYSVSTNDSIAYEFMNDLSFFKQFSYLPLLGKKTRATFIIPFFVVYYLGPNRSRAQDNFLYPMKPGTIDKDLLKLFAINSYTSPQTINYIYLPPIYAFMRGE